MEPPLASREFVVPQRFLASILTNMVKLHLCESKEQAG